MSDPYEILGVQRGDKEEEIKKTYKRISRKKKKEGVVWFNGKIKRKAILNL